MVHPVWHIMCYVFDCKHFNQACDLSRLICDFHDLKYFSSCPGSIAWPRPVPDRQQRHWRQRPLSWGRSDLKTKKKRSSLPMSATHELLKAVWNCATRSGVSRSCSLLAMPSSSLFAASHPCYLLFFLLIECRPFQPDFWQTRIPNQRWDKMRRTKIKETRGDGFLCCTRQLTNWALIDLLTATLPPSPFLAFILRSWRSMLASHTTWLKIVPASAFAYRRDGSAYQTGWAIWEYFILNDDIFHKYVRLVIVRYVQIHTIKKRF